DVLVDRQPVVDGLAVHRRGVTRTAEAREVPGRVDKGVHGVGVTLGRAAALRTGGVLPRRVVSQGIAGALETDVVGQGDGQISDRHGLRTAGGAVNDGDRAAP